MNLDLYAQSYLHLVPKHNINLRTNQFLDVRCRKWGDLTIFLKSSTVIFNSMSAWCQSSSIFFSVIFQCIFQVSGNTVNTATCDCITWNSFSKFLLFFHIAQRVLLLLHQGCFEKVDIHFKRNNVLRNKEAEY